MRERNRREFLFVAGGAGLATVFAAKPRHKREVRVRDLGARGDGKHDDTDAIQAAHDRVRSRGGGVVRLDHGVYRTTRPLLWASGVSLVGAGPASSVLRAVGVTGSVITSDRAYSTDDPFENARFESGCRGLAVQRCTSTKNGKSGFSCGQSELGDPGQDGEVRDSTFEDNHEHGIILAATKEDGASGYRVIANRARGNVSSGLQLAALPAPMINISVIDNKLSDNGSAGIAGVGPGGAASFGFRGNHLVANGRRDRSPGIQLTSNVENLHIEGNWFSDSQSAPTQGPAIHVAPGATIRDGVLAADHATGNPGGRLAVQGDLVNVNRRP